MEWKQLLRNCKQHAIIRRNQGSKRQQTLKRTT
jgi:hypothetical protein